MSQVGIKRLSHKTIFVIFCCLVIACCLFILKTTLTGHSNPTPAASVASSPSKYHDPPETKSGKCLKNYFEDVLLIIVYHFPFYESIPLLESFYNETFKNFVICGPKSNSLYQIMVVDLGRGWYGYECVGEAIRRYPRYRGYLYVNDDMVVNWWTFYKLDKEKFWFGATIADKTCHVLGSRPIRNDWMWWKGETSSAKGCEASYTEIMQKNNHSNAHINITKLIKMHLDNGKGVKFCFKGWSDLFYVPGRFSDQWEQISSVFYKNRVFLEAAVPTIMSFLDSRDSWEKHYGLYLPDKYGFLNFADGKKVWISYNYDIKFIHPVKFHGNITRANKEKMTNEIIPHSKRFTQC